ncbi:hypothetical protein [Aeromonas sp. Y318-1]|uniref:hypothetical protein n=1 Tax=Aeromonas TaxID=642 RepID=UPI0022E84859|nr:hypothetical protein [Aeromonas sp. Y318-1]
MRTDITMNATDQMWHQLHCDGNTQGGSLRIDLSNVPHWRANNLIKLWQQLEWSIIHNNSAPIPHLGQWQQLYSHVSALTPCYALHPSLSLSKSLLEKYNIPQCSLTNKQDMSELKNKLSGYMSELTNLLNTAEHRAKSANFDRLFRRKRSAVNKWLTHHLLMQGMTIVNINLYSPCHTSTEISLSQFAGAFKHTMHALNNKAPQQRGFDGYLWQLRYDTNINYYVNMLLAVDPSHPQHITIDKINHQWRASWQKRPNIPHFIPKPLPVNVNQRASSECAIINQINDITEAFCSQDSIIKLRITKDLKNYHHTKC